MAYIIMVVMVAAAGLWWLFGWDKSPADVASFLQGDASVVGDEGTAVMMPDSMAPGAADTDTSASMVPDDFTVPLTPEQTKLLDAFGLSPDVLTPELEACAAEKLGSERVAAVMAGDTPSALEVMKVMPCLTVNE